MNELSITRLIGAPPEKVWDTMTKRIEEWWCPVPWHAKFEGLEWRVGASANCTMYGPDGEVNAHPGTVMAFEPGKRFAFTDAIVDDLQPNGPFMIGIWSIEPEAGGTRYTAKARHWSEETAKQHAEMGFEEGWGACADQLKALCEAG